MIMPHNLPLATDSASAVFFDDVAEQLHDKTVYKLIKANVRSIHPLPLRALLESLDEHDFDLIDQCTNWFEVAELKGRIIRRREAKLKGVNVTHKFNYPIEEVYDDYVNRRKGKLVEAKRQLHKRFDGLDHDMQEKVMIAFMEQGHQAERNFIYDKLYGEEFWIDDYIPLVQRWWEKFQDYRMIKVVVKHCSREYVLSQLDKIGTRGGYANLCIKTGIQPNPERVSPQTYLFILKSINAQLGFREGEKTVLKVVREYMYEEFENKPVDTIYYIRYVPRMIMYLGEMGLTDDIMALEAFDQRLRTIPMKDRCATAIKIIEETFSFPEYVFKMVK